MTPTLNDDRRAAMLAKVRGLLAKADGTNSPEEAETFRAGAERIMLKYRIEMNELGEQHTDNRPTGRDSDFAWYWNSPWSSSLWSMYLDIAQHCNVKVVYWKAGSTIPVVGTESNLAYFDMLFTTVMLEFSKGLEPQVNPTLSFEENLANLKNAGQQWLRIAEQLRKADFLTEKQFPTDRHYFTDERRKQVHALGFSTKYTKFCAENNLPRLRVTPKIYQRSFAAGFTQEIYDRLHMMRRRAQKDMTSTESNGLALVLASDRDRANARAVELYGQPPARRNGKGGGAGRALALDSSAIQAGREAGARVNLSSPNSGLRQTKEITHGS